MFVRALPTILHADLDSFYASVEQRDDPRLRGKPVIVGGGVVLAASYEAKSYGIHSGMGGGRARALCPASIVVKPRFDAYVTASREVFAIFADSSPLVEALSIDEAFLDVRGLEHILGTSIEIAELLRRRVRAEVGLAITIGLASTKFLAKVASGVAKPDGLLAIPAGAELGFLHPLPVERLWGVGPVTATRLRACGLTTVGRVAALAEPTLIELLGQGSGRKLYALAHNRDPRRVAPRSRRRSMGAQRALGRGRRTPAELDATLMTLVDRVTRRMRAKHRACRTMTLRLRFDDYSRATRSQTVAEATTRTATLLALGRCLLAGAQPTIEARGLTLLGITLSNLCDERAVQLALPLDHASDLDTTLDSLRDRFGTEAIQRGALLGRPVEQWLPQLDD
jgi:DNA polymerase IV